MRVLICGIDGYIGWSLALHLCRIGMEVSGVDNLSRRRAVAEIGSDSATPILSIENRLRSAKSEFGFNIAYAPTDMRDFKLVNSAVLRARPDTVVHLAEQPSAPYSMIDREHAIHTQGNNVVGTLNLLFAMKDSAPRAHLLKLGTMGEYGTPNLEIPEGFFEVEYKGRRDRLPFPRQASSFYHWSKVHDSGNIMFASKLWNLRATDVMQGVVYGTRTDASTPEGLLTRFDFDEVFGTVVNRFCAQAVVGYPLTQFGKGGQRRGFIALVDSIRCLTLAIDNPPEPGEYRVFNQLDETLSVSEIAVKVRRAAKKEGLAVKVGPTTNPRVEKENEFYKVDTSSLRKLGFRPTRSMEDELGIMLKDLIRYRARIEAKKQKIAPTISWREGKKRILLEDPQRVRASSKRSL